MNRLDLLLKSKVVKYLDKHHITPTPPGPSYEGLCISMVEGTIMIMNKLPWEYCLASDDPTNESNWHDGPVFQLPEDEEEEIPDEDFLTIDSAIFCRSDSEASYTDGDYTSLNFVFRGDGKVKVSGDIASMAGYNDGHAYPYCYNHMFYYDSFFPLLNLVTAVVDASELTISEVAEGSCDSMFACNYDVGREHPQILVSAPMLPATDLSASCYAHMFEYCGYLQGTIEIPAESLALQSCEGMFAYCGFMNITDPAHLDYDKALSVKLTDVQPIRDQYTSSYLNIVSYSFIKDFYIATEWTGNWETEIANTFGYFPFTIHCPSSQESSWSTNWLSVFQGCTVVGDYNP